MLTKELDALQRCIVTVLLLWQDLYKGNPMSGIMMPMLQYRFRISLDEIIDPNRVFTQNVVSYEADYKNKKINLVVRQPATDAGMSNIISSICDMDNVVITMEALGTGSKDPKVEFLNEIWIITKKILLYVLYFFK